VSGACLDPEQPVMGNGGDMASILPAITLAAASTVLGDLPLVEVEQVFWDCDFKGTQHILDFDDAHTCSIVFERLKAEKFNSEFDRFMEWWRTNKGREYAARVEVPRYRRDR
jgi:hypothetical protein